MTACVLQLVVEVACLMADDQVRLMSLSLGLIRKQQQLSAPSRPASSLASLACFSAVKHIIVAGITIRDSRKRNSLLSLPLSTGRRYHSASPSKLHRWCSTVSAADVRSTLVMCTPSPCTHHCGSFAIAISRPRWHRRTTCMVHLVWLLHFLYVRTNNLEQTSTGSVKHGH